MSLTEKVVLTVVAIPVTALLAVMVYYAFAVHFLLGIAALWLAAIILTFWFLREQHLSDLQGNQPHSHL